MAGLTYGCEPDLRLPLTENPLGEPTQQRD